MAVDDWDARLFVERLLAGAFDGCITQTLAALSASQLNEVHEILAASGGLARIV